VLSVDSSDEAGAAPERSRVRGRVALLAAAAGALAVAAAAAVAAQSDPAPPKLPPNALRVDVLGVPTSSPHPRGFIGFSIEYHSTLGYFGSDPAKLNPTFLRLVHDVNPGGSPVIRVGGDSTDWTWWPTPGVARPPGVRYTLTRRWLAVTRAVATALGARLILGINLEADRRAIASAEARAFLHGIGRRRIADFELGNEPEVYGTLGWYTRAHRGVPGRPANYDFQSYLRDYATISSALPRGVPLAGPASGAPGWVARVRRFLAANRRVRLVTFHRYPLRPCSARPGSPAYPTIPNLLAPTTATAPAAGLQSAVGVAHARGLALRSDELNSASCGGARGVSDTFASALWVLDTLFHMTQAGVDGVNIHTLRRARYQPFVFTDDRGGWRAQVKPVYYGLLMFARAAPSGSTLLATSSPSYPAVRVWATRAPDGVVRVALIDASPTRAVAVAIRPPYPAARARLERLTAPSLSSTGGVTIAGQSFADDARLTGDYTTTTLRPIAHRYAVTLAPGSAALLTLTGS
jgi:hypothetical protein